MRLGPGGGNDPPRFTSYLRLARSTSAFIAPGKWRWEGGVEPPLRLFSRSRNRFPHLAFSRFLAVLPLHYSPVLVVDALRTALTTPPSRTPFARCIGTSSSCLTSV